MFVNIAAKKSGTGYPVPPSLLCRDRYQIRLR
jgi:hypothetical protein